MTAVDQLIWPDFEIVVVADTAGCEVAREFEGVKVVAFDRANLSMARNHGIAASGGDVIAFIDDDAVPEPAWLAALASAFEDASVGAATGPVLGRNGITPQSGAETILHSGETVRARRDPARRKALADRAPKTVGTNMAFRADLLRLVGGFDEHFAYFFEESDLNIRLGDMGVVTAYVPNAVVHHGFASSSRRREDRTPTDLFDIGRSSVLFLRYHCGPDMDAAMARIREGECARAMRGLVSGRLEPRDVRRLLKSFDAGVSEGKAVETTRMLRRFEDPLAYAGRRRTEWHHTTFGGRTTKRQEVFEHAQAAHAEGAIVTVVLLSRTSLYHRIGFEDGFWVQRGGVFGRSDRSESLITLTTANKRFEREVARVSRQRGIDRAEHPNLPPNCTVSAARLSFF